MGLRITDQGLANSRMGWIAEGRSRTAEVEQAISTGRRIHQPSDDPLASTQAMRHDARLQRISQYQRNNDNAKLWIGAADTALQSAATNLERARTLAVQAGNDTMGSVPRVALATDLRAIGDGLRTIANTRVSGRAIFAGTSGTADAYDSAGSYLGDSGAVVRTIDTNEPVVVGSPGPEVFGTGDPADPMNGTVFELIAALADAVEAGDSARIRAGIEAVDTATARIASAQGRVGAISQQLAAADFRHDGERLAVQTDLSKIRDIDMAEAIIRLRSAEAGYEATLSATARALSRSLLDFLR